MKFRQYVGDLLFGVQLILAIFFCGTQFVHMLMKGVGPDVSVMLFLSVQTFMTINLVLAIKADKAKRSRATLQVVSIHCVWTTIWGINLIFVLKAVFENPKVFLRANEAAALFTIVTGLALVRFLAKKKKLRFRDPLVMGGNAIVFKVVPQLFQAWKFATLGGASWSGPAVLLGHTTILTRLGQLYLTIREEGRDRNRIAIAVSDIANEFSWTVATIAWLVWRF